MIVGSIVPFIWWRFAISIAMFIVNPSSQHMALCVVKKRVRWVSLMLFRFSLPTSKLPPFGLRPRSRGFTLIELMVVISIVGIVVAAAVPSMQESRVRSQVRAASQEIVDGMRWARSEALRTNELLVFRIWSPGGSPIPRCGGRRAAWGVFPAGSTTALKCVRHTEFISRYPALNPLTSQTISFEGNGAVVASLKNYEIRSSKVADSYRLLNVELSGRISAN
jgi:prepilin-type N-terminal cleavage/methylation domain-containing protein